MGVGTRGGGRSPTRTSSGHRNSRGREARRAFAGGMVPLPSSSSSPSHTCSQQSANPRSRRDRFLHTFSHVRPRHGQRLRCAGTRVRTGFSEGPPHLGHETRGHLILTRVPRSENKNQKTKPQQTTNKPNPTEQRQQLGAGPLASVPPSCLLGDPFLSRRLLAQCL